MQLSAANLIIASQQIARGAAKPVADGQFAQALAKEQGVKETDAFEAMEFKRAATAAKPAMATPAQAPAMGYGASGSMGANLDIRV